MGSSMYTIRDVPGRGKGLVATKKIPRGTRILCEEPVITIPENETNTARLRTCIARQVDGLSEDKRQTFLSMHNIHAYGTAAEQYLAIVRTVALPIGSGGIDGGIFLDACRINHACDNNAQKSWNENIKRHTVHALRDIDEGEEITIYYISIVNNREARQKALQAKFQFTCSCRLCSLPPEQSRESDQRLDEIYRLDNVIGCGAAMGILQSPLRTLRYVDRQVQLYNKQGPGDVGLPRAFLDAAQIVIAHGDLARGRVFAQRAVDGWRMAGGDDSTQVMQHGSLPQDPSKLELYGISMKWKTAVDEAPCGLQPGDFEDWLWKRDKPQRPGQPVDLRNRKAFPAFTDLPDDRAIDLDFYEGSNTSVRQPRRHWCFLAEIVDFSRLLRLSMEIKDVDGKQLPLFFYTDTRGSELAPKKFQRGYTVAILYAQYHAFKFDKPGIRHEDPQVIKILPISLHDLLALNDQIQTFSTESGGLRMCHGCGKKGASLNRCTKCSAFWYCNKTCQAAGWNAKGHKAHCKLLKDPDLRGLFLLQWDKFESEIQFPLHVAEDFKNGVTASCDNVTNDMEEKLEIAILPSKAVAEPTVKLYDIRAIDGKGRGVVATTRITKGTRILSEAPLFTVPRTNSDKAAMDRIVVNQVNRLSDEQRRSFFDLTNIFGNAHSESFGIARTNVLPLGSKSDSGGLFLEASRINHSCKHNAQNTWNENIGQLTIHALRDIEPGQEITITYLSRMSEYAERQQFLREKFGFKCTCEVCSLPLAQRKSSDTRLRKLHDLDTSVEGFYFGDLKKKPVLRQLRTMFVLFDEEGIWNASIARAYKDAYNIATRSHDDARARVFAERAYEARRVIEGDDSPVTIAMKEAFEELSALPPQEMNESQREKWLWMRS